MKTSQDLSSALSNEASITFTRRAPKTKYIIDVNPNIKYQTIAGFGPSMTDSSAYLIYRYLSASARDGVLQRLFSPRGAGMDLMRIPLGASDFTANGIPYSYDDIPQGQYDISLKHFSVAHDTNYIFKVLRLITAINPRMKKLGSVWSPPAFLKANDSLTREGGNGNRNDTLISQPWAESTLANYYLRTIKAFSAAGIVLDAVTTGNEPLAATSYPSMFLPASREQRFIRILYDTLRSAGLTTDIYGGDVSFGRLPGYGADIAKAFPTGDVIAGVASHCYGGPVGAMQLLHNRFPALKELMTECSPSIRPMSTIEDIIAVLRSSGTGAIFWNTALDPNGGPVQPPNSGCSGCTAPVTISRMGHVTYNAEFYQIGQVSKFIRPGAQRIASNSFVGYSVNSNDFPVNSHGIDDVAARNRNGGIVLVIHDASPFAGYVVGVRAPEGYVTVPMRPGDTVTLSWHPPGGK